MANTPLVANLKTSAKTPAPQNRATPASALPRVGQRFGKFMLTARMGQGSEGLVFRALHVGLNLDRAIRIMTFQGAAGRQALERLENEARLLIRIEHPNIVRVFDLEDDGDRTYLVMEFIEGLNLAELIAQSGRVAVDRTLQLIIQIANGLRLAAGFRVVHREVRPENILLTKDGTAKLSDLGAGIMAGNDTDDGRDRARRIVGIPAHMAPEQLGGSAPIDHRVDIYALGAVFYHAVTGRPPFEADSVRELAFKKNQAIGQPDGLIPPERWCPELRAEVSAVICRMMAPNPADRYQDYDELLAALEGLRSGPSPVVKEAGLLSTATNDARRTQQLTHLRTPTSIRRMPGLAESIRMAMDAVARGDNQSARQAVLPHKESSSGSEAVWLMLIKASDTLDEAIGYAEEGMRAAPTSERLRTMAASLAKQKPAPRKCFFCMTPDTGTLACQTCGGLTTLPMPEDYPATVTARKDLMLRAITAYDNGIRDRPSARWQYALGLAWLTMRQDRQALPYLQAAARGGFAVPINALAALEKRIADEDAAARRTRIAIVDDSPIIRKLVQSKLEEFEITVLPLATVEEAMNKLPAFEPHLILLEINMPGQDGYQTCRWVRNHQSLHGVPVVLLSGADGLLDKVRGRMAGASRHIGKPFVIDELLQVIDTLCAKSSRVLS